MKQKEYWSSVSEKKEFTTPFQAEEFSKYVKKIAVSWMLAADMGGRRYSFCGFNLYPNK